MARSLPRALPLGPLAACLAAALLLGGMLATGLLAAFVARLGQDSACEQAGTTAVEGTIALSAPGASASVGATEYGGPGDPSSGTVGADGQSLLANPDSYAELGGYTQATATALGGLPFLTPLRITWEGHQALALKRDIGLGGGPIDGVPRGIDLWWQLAARLGIPYEQGRWSGVVQVQRLPAGGSGEMLEGVMGSGDPSASPARHCPAVSSGAVALVPGERAQLMPGGLAAAPADAPAAVREMIAAGNQIVGRPYALGGGHGLPLSALSAVYDCSSSVEHLLWGGGLLPPGFDAPSGTLESWGLPGPGRWVTIYASADHVFMYVAGLRWDTHDAAGAGDGSTGIGWHPLVREAAGFVVRHPAGL